MKENKTQSQAIQQIFVSLPVWNIESITGYKPQTTFWQDFSIADRFGVTAVQDTFNRAFAEWKSNYIYLTEMVMVLNHKIWQWYQKNDELSKLYDKSGNKQTSTPAIISKIMNSHIFTKLRTEPHLTVMDALAAMSGRSSFIGK